MPLIPFLLLGVREEELLRTSFPLGEGVTLAADEEERKREENSNEITKSGETIAVTMQAREIRGRGCKKRRRKGD